MYNSSAVAAAFVGAVQHAFDVNKRQRVIKFFSGYHKHVWLVKEFTVHLILKQAFSKQSPLSSICARTQRSVGCKINNGFRVCSQNVVLVFKIVLNIRQINFLAQLIKIKKILKSGIALWQRTLKKIFVVRYIWYQVIALWKIFQSALYEGTLTFPMIKTLNALWKNMYKSLILDFDFY